VETDPLNEGRAMGEDHPQIRARHDLGADEVEDLEDRLYAFNAAATGMDDGQGLVFVAETADGLAGAVAGYTWGGICELRQVWVADAHRGGGLGRRLMAAAVGEARARGCACVLLATYDFQAPGFYARLGFRTVAEIPDKPLGHTEYVMRLPLGGAEPGFAPGD
jgi:ribosomal protein S18 acetylase RimI-like enzyme